MVFLLWLSIFLVFWVIRDMLYNIYYVNYYLYKCPALYILLVAI